MNPESLSITAACDANNLKFLCSWNDPSMTEEQKVRQLMDLGAHIFAGGEEMAKIGRKITRRKMPVG
ncbi:MAG: hypothetical protein VYC65_04365 [Chloroflexota bacterium]|nr:hypothetical protein [Chloroflexota bacterium]MQG37466.1 hypothetical protein [SAR202 cluster bacterium]